MKELDSSRPGQPAPQTPQGPVFDQSPRGANAFAETDCALLAMNRDALLGLVKTNPGLGVALLTATAERMRFLSGCVN